MKINLPVKLLYPALAAAALLSAASVGLHAAYNSYTQCRCSQPSPQSPYNSLTTCCGDSSYASLNQTACCGDITWGTANAIFCCGAEVGGFGVNDGDTRCGCVAPQTWIASRHGCRTPCTAITCGAGKVKASGITYDEEGPSGASGNCCVAGTPGKIVITASQGTGTNSIDVMSYGQTTGSDCSGYTGSSNCTSVLSTFLSGRNATTTCSNLNPATGQVWQNNDACDKNTFVTCSRGAGMVGAYSAGIDTGYCFVPGNSNYPCANSAFGIPCSAGCSGSNGIWTCQAAGGGNAPVTVSSPTKPIACWRWQCTCYPHADIITCV